MKILLFVLAGAVLGAQVRTVKPEELCTLEGRVLNAATGAPLGDAKLKLTPTGAQAGTPVSFVTSSDEKGNFAFAGIEPGAYRFSAERRGYVSSNYGERRSNQTGTPITLASTERKSGLEFRLVQQGVISGRLLNADGEPMGRVLNQATGDGLIFLTPMRVVYENGRRVLRNYTRAGMTASAPNDLGEYRITGLEPGRYYISATPLRSGPGRPQNLSGRTPKTSQTTFYPSAAGINDATPVDVSAGATITGIDIRVIRSEAFPVRVTLLDRTGLNLNTLTLTLQPPGGFGAGVSQGVGSVRGPKGQVDLGMMPRGRTPVQVTAYNTQGPALWTRRTLDVSGPIDGLELAVNPGFTVQGQIGVENSGIPKGIKVSLTVPDLPTEARSTMKPADPAADGSFTLTNVSANRYSVEIAGIPKGYYLKSIRLGSQDALESDLDLTEAPERPLEIVIGANPGAVEGEVKNAIGSPAAGSVVALVPQDPKRRERPDWYRTAIAGAEGKFSMADLRPGDYKLFAWDDLEDGAWMDPAFIKQQEAQGKPVVIREGASEKVELRSIPAQ